MAAPQVATVYSEKEDHSIASAGDGEKGETLETISDPELTPAEEKKLVRKIDMR